MSEWQLQKLLGWLSRHEGLLESQIVASGLSKALNEAILRGWADITDIGVRERSGVPAAAYKITDKGRAALPAPAPSGSEQR